MNQELNDLVPPYLIDQLQYVDASQEPDAATALCRDAAIALEAMLAAAPRPSADGEATSLHGPHGYLNGNRGLNEEYWRLEGEPDNGGPEYFSIPLYALSDPFSEIGRSVLPSSADADAAGVELEARIFNVLVHDFPAPYVNVTRLAKKLAALVASQPTAGEPVAWIMEADGAEPILAGNPEAASYGRVQGWRVTPLYAQPPAPVVTDAMVERACNAAGLNWDLWGSREKKAKRELMRATLTAALTTKGEC